MIHKSKCSWNSVFSSCFPFLFRCSKRREKTIPNAGTVWVETAKCENPFRISRYFIGKNHHLPFGLVYIWKTWNNFTRIPYLRTHSRGSHAWNLKLSPPEKMKSNLLMSPLIFWEKHYAVISCPKSGCRVI